MPGMFNTYYDVNRLSLWGEKGNQENRPRLAIQFRDGNPGFMNYTGEIGSVISFPCNYNSFSGILEAFESILDAPPGARISIDRSIGKPGEDKKLISTLHIGKSKDGVIYLSLVEESKPKTAYAFRKDDWHNYKDEAGEPIDVAKLSRWYAAGYLKLVRNSLAIMLGSYTSEAYNKGDYKPKEIEQNGKGNFTPKGKGSSESFEASPKPKIPELNEVDLTEDISF